MRAVARGGAGTGFAMRDALPWRQLAAIAGAAEGWGYGAVFLPEISGRDALVTLGMLAGETGRLRLGSGVVPMRSRTPLLTAMGAATVHERSGGRMILGLGTGSVGSGALDELRATVATVRSLLAGGEVERRGTPVQLALPPGPELPIWISALGPKAMRLAGEVADGVLLNWCPPERIAFARERVREGAELAGRDPASITVGVYVRAWMGVDEAEAMRALKVAAGQYASYASYRRQFEQVGLRGQAAVAAEAFRAGRPDDVPEALVRAVCAIGPGARGRIQAFREAGADLPIVYPVAGGSAAASIETTLRSLSPGA